tara:strand:- start:214 stop:435 length:222 start_codon:yes stop_codon:yes gene_type:complete
MECKNMSLKSDINCILDTYEKEVRSLIYEAKEILEMIESGRQVNRSFLEQKVSDLCLRNELLDSCKEDCIKEL